MDRPGTCIIILDKKYNIANSSCHFGSYGSIWTCPSPQKYYMDLRSFGIFLVTDRSIYCHMTLSAVPWTICYIEYTSPWTGFELTTLVVIGTDCTGNWQWIWISHLIPDDLNNFLDIISKKNGIMCSQHMDAPTSSWSKQGHNSREEKVVKFEMVFLLLATDLVHNFQMICVFCIQLFEVRVFFLFSRYWWNCWLLLFKMFFIIDACEIPRFPSAITYILQGRIQGRRTRRAPLLKLEKIWFSGVKSWFSTQNTPKIFVPPSARCNYFKCTPP